jgi:hypothetical protein
MKSFLGIGPAAVRRNPVAVQTNSWDEKWRTTIRTSVFASSMEMALH